MTRIVIPCTFARRTVLEHNYIFVYEFHGLSSALCFLSSLCMSILRLL
jgi:hypothetical protein